MSKHTPGPWSSSRCYVQQESQDGTMNKVICDTEHSDFGVDIGVANAKLIAAAPEMLQALEGFVRQFESGILPQLACQKAKEAIAKAKGEK